MLIAIMSLTLFAGCQAAIAYLLYDLTTGGPIFGGDDNGNGTGNHPPQIITIQALPGTVSIGGTATISAVVTDEDNDTITYLWQASKGQFSSPTTAVTMWTAPTDFTGTFQITLTVNDGQGGSDIDYVEVKVTL
jgi:hypothetical protein